MEKIKIYTKVISLLIVLTFILTGNVYPLEYRGALRVPLRGAAIVAEQLRTITDKTPDSISAPLLTQEEITVLERPVKWIMAQLKVEPGEYDEIRNKVLDILSPVYRDRENAEKQQEATKQLAILWRFNLGSKLRHAEKELAELVESNLAKDKKRESELEKSILAYKATEKLNLGDITLHFVKMIPADLESSKGEAFITLSRLPRLTRSNLKLDKPIGLQGNGFIMLRGARAILIGSNQCPDGDIKDLMKTLRYILNEGEIEALNLLAGEDMQGISITKTKGRNTAISFYALPGCLFTEREIILILPRRLLLE